MITETQHGFCPLHRIAYNRDLDPVCPQCSMQGIMPPEQLNYDNGAQMPLDASGKRLSPRTLKPVG